MRTDYSKLFSRVSYNIGRILPKLTALYNQLSGREKRFHKSLSECDLFVVSEAKSGRTWLRAMLSRYYQELYGLPTTEIIEFDNLHNRNSAVPKIFFVHTNELQRYAPTKEVVAKKRVLHISRMPIDTAVSKYFQATGRTTAFKRAQSQLPYDMSTMPIYDFISSPRTGVPLLVDKLNWIADYFKDHQQYFSVSYESAVADPRNALKKMIAINGFDPAAKEADVERALTVAVDATSFNNLRKTEISGSIGGKRLKPGNAKDESKFKVRRGKVGGYRDYLKIDEAQKLEDYMVKNLNASYGYNSIGAI